MPNDPTSRRGMKRKTMTRNQYHSVPRSISSSGDTEKESQFIRTELEILLPMRLQNGGDREMAFPGQAQIVVDIAARVDHHGEPVSAPQNVRVVPQAARLQTLKEHGDLPKRIV